MPASQLYHLYIENPTCNIIRLRDNPGAGNAILRGVSFTPQDLGILSERTLQKMSERVYVQQFEVDATMWSVSAHRK